MTENDELKLSIRRMLKDSLERKDEKTGKLRQELLADALVDKGITGDVRAFETIREIVGDGRGSITVVLSEEAEELAR